jgi:hypothetical protein
VLFDILDMACGRCVRAIDLAARGQADLVARSIGLGSTVDAALLSAAGYVNTGRL